MKSSLKLVAIAWFPLTLLFLSPTYVTSIDWNNHLWQIEYGAAFFRAHHRFPFFLNTPALIGLPQPVFYGGIFYPALSFLSLAIPAELVVRGLLLGLAAAQAVLLEKLVRSRGLVCLGLWAIYPLTNLYHRGALPEAVAVSLLTLGSLLWLYRPQSFLSGSGLFILAAGTHPITGALGALALAGLALASPPPRRQLIAGGLLAVGALAPWLWVVARLGTDTYVQRYLGGLEYFQGIDSLWIRLLPLPYDGRMFQGSPTQVTTPYLEAQLNTPLLLAVAFGVWGLRPKRGVPSSLPLRLFSFSLVLFLLALVPSVLPLAHFFPLPSPLHFIQFAYRLVSYQNLALLWLIIAVVQWRGSPPGGIKFLVGLAAIAVGLKLAHVVQTDQHFLYKQAALQPTGRTLDLPRLFYGAGDYAVTRGLTPWSSADGDPNALPRIALPVSEEDWGIPTDLSLTLPQATYVVTNVLAFPWAQIHLDGNAVPAASLRTIAQGRVTLLMVPVPAGGHRLAVSFSPPAIWVWLRRLSALTLMVWLAIALRQWLWGTSARAAWLERQLSPR